LYQEYLRHILLKSGSPPSSYDRLILVCFNVSQCSNCIVLKFNYHKLIQIMISFTAQNYSLNPSRI